LLGKEGEGVIRTSCRRIVHLFTSEEGQDLIEYGLLAALLSVALLALLSLVARQVSTVFSRIASTISL
jgi:Flp pilus assembly pilin Flp